MNHEQGFLGSSGKWKRRLKTYGLNSLRYAHCSTKNMPYEKEKSATFIKEWLVWKQEWPADHVVIDKGKENSPYNVHVCTQGGKQNVNQTLFAVLKGYFQMFLLCCKLNKPCVPLHLLQVFHEKLLFQVHSHWLSFLIQITKDLEEEVCVVKQDIKREKKYFCLISSAFPLCPKLAQNTALWGRWEFFLSFSSVMNEEWQKGVCLHNFPIRNI